MKEPQFAINRGQGFSITFSNGVTVSVQFGDFSYCNNKDKENRERHAMQEDKYGGSRYSCENAEVAIYNSKGWLTKEYKDEGDDVLSHIEPDEVARIIQWCINYKEDGGVPNE